MKRAKQHGRSNSSHTRSPLEEKMIALTRDLQTHKKNVKEVFEKFVGEVSTKVNGLAKLVGQQQAQIGVLAGAGEGMDQNILAMGEMLKEVFGQLSMVDEMLKVLDFKKDDKPLEEHVDVDAVKATALAWYQEVLTDSYDKAKKRMETHRAAQAAAKEETEKLKAQVSADTKERERIEAEIRGKQGEVALSTPTSDEPHVPEGATIFGG
jgi:hypothetical protein